MAETLWGNQSFIVHSFDCRNYNNTSIFAVGVAGKGRGGLVWSDVISGYQFFSRYARCTLLTIAILQQYSASYINPVVLL